jgi:ribonuclease E
VLSDAQGEVMSKKMLIDASHAEETRVVVIDSNKNLCEFDFNSTLKKTVKGNVYLAKVARIEPSLQAAFIDYGCDRHGFLAFNEIHPDYFRIPVSDREQLQQEMSRLASDESTENHDSSNNLSDDGIDVDTQEKNRAYESLHKRYKIQEVLHKGQIILVQVVREERGGKGAALTTFLSLPGRYCVLMPNSPKSGGVSRKISNQTDRIRLKKSLEALELPAGMGLIVRTAGKDRTKSDIRKDAEYLMRLWNNVRETTLSSIAPAIVYEEDDIIKRAIRDMYSKDIDDVLVEGEEGYKIAKNFMKTLMPSHAKKIKLYKDNKIPLFHSMGVETQLETMYKPQVSLFSGGSIVIHPTEALVSIDINSGKSTRERHIEETALKTNMEAAYEIVRQVRLRDLAGLIVIDFIDMNDSKHVAMVERRVKELFKQDRARVQVGRISSFGLLEISRQRLSPSILETSSYVCTHCHGTGYQRSTESLAVHVLRMIEQNCLIGNVKTLNVKVNMAVAFYIFNKKRFVLHSIESRQNVSIEIEPDTSLGIEGFVISKILRSKDDIIHGEEKSLAHELIVGSEEKDSDKRSASHMVDANSEEGDPESVPRKKKNRRKNRRSKSNIKADGVDNSSSYQTEEKIESTETDQSKESTILSQEIIGANNSSTTDVDPKTPNNKKRKKRSRNYDKKKTNDSQQEQTELQEGSNKSLDAGAVEQIKNVNDASSQSSNDGLVSKGDSDNLQQQSDVEKKKKIIFNNQKIGYRPRHSAKDSEFSIKPMDPLVISKALQKPEPIESLVELKKEGSAVAKASNKTWWRRILNSQNNGKTGGK